MSGLDDLIPGLSALTSDAFNAVRKRQARLNLFLQDAENHERARAERQASTRKPPPAAVSPKTGKRRTRSKNREGCDVAFDDEWRRRQPGRRVAGKDAGVAPTSGRSVAPATPKPHASNVEASRPTAAAVAARPDTVVKAGLATGSQAAVVKLASFAGGGSRLGALMTYQSHDGEIALELADGTQVAGIDGIRALAEQWAGEAPARELSKDVMMFAVTMDGERGDDQVRAALAASLPGHRYAWHVDRSGLQARAEVVTTAASSQRDEKGKAFRIYDNQKSIGAFADRVTSAIGATAAFEARGFSHGVEGAARYLSRLTRGGAEAAELAGGGSLVGHEANLSVAKSWKRDLRSREQRDVAHVILSAKPGTDRDAFVAAARATLEREFAGHDFAFALHENRAHLHVHVVVKMQRRDGGRMHPRIQDFARWRATLAEEARERNIPMEAASRFEQANPPGYKLKDIRLVERGQASENVRRRVEALRTSAVHVPTRPEGRERARTVAGQWERFALAVAIEPPIAEGAMRLYRADRPGAKLTSAPLFARDRAAAEAMATRSGGSVSYVDVPHDRLGDLKASRTAPGRVFVVPADMAAQRKPLSPAAVDGEPMGRVLELRTRTVTAARLALRGETMENQSSYRLPNYSNSARIEVEAPASVATRPRTEGSKDMPELETMQKTRPELMKHLQALVDNAPEGRQEEVRLHQKRIVDNYDRAIQVQAKQETNVGIEGDTYVTPKPRAYDNFTAFVPEQRGEAIRYAHKYDDGSAGKVAFTDTGKRVEVNDWKDKEATLAAMQLATEKWGELTVKGPEKYKSMVISLAAEHGYKIANPELQDRLEAEKARIAADRENRPGFEGPAGRKEAKPGKRQVSQEPRPGAQIPTPMPDAELPQSERDAKYAEAYRDVTAHKSASVDNFVTVLRDSRYGEGQAGNPYEKRKEAEVAIAMARREAINSLPANDQLRFAQASARFAEYNNGVNAQQLQDAERRGERQAGQAAGSSQAQGSGVPVVGGGLQGPGAPDPQAGNSQSQVLQRGPVRTEVERNAELAQIQRRTDEEAHRETRQANMTSAQHEAPGDPGYRSQGEAASARAADHAVETNRKQDIPVTLDTSPEIHRLADEQARVKAEQQQADQQKQPPPKDRPRGQRM